MFDNMTGFVGYAMHEDRLRHTVTNARRTEVKRVRMQLRESAPHPSWRASVARVLIALATRIAPTVAANPGTRALAR